MMVEKHNVHPTKSQEKWQIRLEKDKLRNPPSFFNKSLIKNTSAFAQR
jgi:hypothetical protein